MRIRLFGGACNADTEEYFAMCVKVGAATGDEMTLKGLFAAYRELIA